jgi:hypothetical protein
VATARLGYFEDFKSSDTLLIEADSEGLRKLAELLRLLERGSAKIVTIHTQPFVERHHGIALTAFLGRRDLVARTGDESRQFRWERTASSWGEAADKVWALAERDGGHQYLDLDGDAHRFYQRLGFSLTSFRFTPSV